MIPYYVCKLTEVQAREFEFRGILPECANCNPKSEKRGAHEHVKIQKANELVGANDGTGDASWVGGYRMIRMNAKGGWNPFRGVMQMTEYVSRGNPQNRPLRAQA